MTIVENRENSRGHRDGTSAHAPGRHQRYVPGVVVYLERSRVPRLDGPGGLPTPRHSRTAA